MKRKQRILTILAILGFGMAMLVTLPGCSDQSETKDLEAKKKDGNSVAKKPTTDSPGKPEAGKDDKDDKGDAKGTPAPDGKKESDPKEKSEAKGEPDQGADKEIFPGRRDA